VRFTIGMAYKPNYQKRKGKCHHCEQGIVIGDQVMIGMGFWNGICIRHRLHFSCYMEALKKYTSDWFFENDYKPNRMAPEQVILLNRLRAKRYYIRKTGGDKNEIDMKVAEVEKQIALIKADK
jgi:hypothetical protein